MSEFYKWTAEELGLGVAEMDKEHQILIDKMNALYKASEKKASEVDLQKLVDDLAAYTIQHFADEEAYMGKIQFQGLETHKIIHKQLLSQFQEHIEKFKITKEFTPAFFNFLKVWLTSHIRGIDMKYADFQKKVKAS